jgi:hypothetical protein
MHLATPGDPVGCSVAPVRQPFLEFDLDNWLIA